MNMTQAVADVAAWTDASIPEAIQEAMDNTMYHKIIGVEAELSAYRRGSVRIHIDIEKKLVTWKDSQQWNNNFLRSVSAARLNQFLEDLPSTHLLEWNDRNTPEASCGCTTCIPADWNVSVFFDGIPPIRISGRDTYPAEWRLFRSLVEAIAKNPFCLR